ncbi:MAG: allophanate hydrolase [Caulobacterales bacterium]
MIATSFDRLSLIEVAADVGAGRRSAVQVARAALARTAAYDSVQPQVWIHRLPQAQVLAQARLVDKRIAAGEVLPLAGAPFAVKDNIDVAGSPTTAGCPAFAYDPAETAPVVTRLLAAGAVLIGKTNLDQFATGLVGARSPYGACGSAYNREYISGGSSSGSAVAVAAGLVAFALGTDTAGSGRVPAALNHLFGLKPTRGRWSTRGVVPACRSLDCVSVLTSTAAEAERIDDVVAGFDPDDPFSRRPPGVRARAWPRRLRLGVAAQLDWLGDHQSRRLYAAAVQRLKVAGARLVEVDIGPLRAGAAMLYQGPWVAERTAAVEALLRTQPDAIHPVVRGILEGGLGFSAVDTFRAYYRLKALVREAEAIWRGVDVLLLPTVAATYRVREVLSEPLALNANLGLYTNFVNLFDLAAVAVPAGFRDNATGFGVSLIAPAWADRQLLELARRYEEVQPMPKAPPIDVAGVKTRVKLAVVGAHLEGMPLHWQLASREAKLAQSCRTAPTYKALRDGGRRPAQAGARACRGRRRRDRGRGLRAWP